ncbi:MAG: M23 family metallopeptidase [Chitinophagales bacterium]
MAEEKKKRRFVEKLKNKYRLVVLNDDTFEEKASFRLSRFNVYVFVSTVLSILVVLIFSMIIFTPLKEYIPGYADVKMRRDLIDLKFYTDSLESVVLNQSLWLNNVKKILEGKTDSATVSSSDRNIRYDTIKLSRIPIEDVLLREEIEREDNYALVYGDQRNSNNETEVLSNLTTPLRGLITQRFNADDGHFGIDVVAPEKTPVKSIAPGTVIISEWTLETGHTIAVQHDNNLISIYKHNSVLLKKVGNFVKSGDAIAIIGNSGELSSGPHLHFELWQEGSAVDPEQFISF